MRIPPPCSLSFWEKSTSFPGHWVIWPSFFTCVSYKVEMDSISISWLRHAFSFSTLTPWRIKSKLFDSHWTHFSSVLTCFPGTVLMGSPGGPGPAHTKSLANCSTDYRYAYSAFLLWVTKIHPQIWRNWFPLSDSVLIPYLILWENLYPCDLAVMGM